MIVMTMILTRLTAESSRVGYVCVNWEVHYISREFTQIIADPSSSA